MIQRKQTLFLLIAAALLAAFAFSVVATASSASVAGVVNGDGAAMEVTASQMMLDAWTWSVDGDNLVRFPYFGGLTLFAAALVFATIFLFRKRLLQIRLCYVAWVLILGVMAFQGFYLYHLYDACASQEGWIVAPTIWNAMPVIALIMVWFAYKGVVRDEALVRSADRIR